MGREFNILVTAASRRVAMIRGFILALAGLGLRGKVVCADSDPLSASLRFCHGHHIVPLSSAPEYIDRILDICRKEQVHMVVPTIDEELETFARRREEFLALGVLPLVSSAQTCRICRDKRLTWQFFKDHGLPFAETFLPEEFDYAKARYPLFIKPRKGRGSVGAHRIANERELRFFTTYVHEPVIQRYLPGQEFTVDALAGLDGRILSIVPRERMVIRSGVCDRGMTRLLPDMIEVSRKILETLGVTGPVNLQCKLYNGETTFFEVNPRFSGAIQLTTAAGADFFSLVLREAMGERVPPAIGEFTDRFLMLSYEESVFEPGPGS